MKLMILDSNSILNRAFYGMPPLTTRSGEPSGAVYGFLNILLKLIAQEKPDCIVAAFDVKAKTFRHELYAGYKAQRKPPAPELVSQIAVAKELLDALRIHRIEQPGFEGDDIIGSLTHKFSDVECVIVTGDKDSLQLIDGHTRVLLSVPSRSGSESVVYDAQTVREKLGVSPEQVIDLKAIMGDSSDNVPGVPGIGEKGAVALLSAFETLDGVYAHLGAPSIKPGTRKKLEEGKESAYLSRRLVTIRTDMELTCSLDDLRLAEPDEAALYSLLERLEFTNFLERMNLSPQKQAIGKSVEITDIPPAELLSRVREDEPIAFLPQGEDLILFAAGALYRTRPDDVFLRALFGREKPSKTTFGSKPFLRKLLDRGLEAKGIDFDLKVAAYVLNPSMSHYSVDAILREQLNVTIDGETSAVSFFLAARERMTQALRDGGMLSLYTEVEQPLTGVLAQMEHDGFCLDKRRLLEFGQTLDARIRELTASIYFCAGREFNIQSPKQLGEVLFDDLGLPVYAKTKTGYSTNAEVLEKLRGYHEIVDLILEYRRLTKLNSTYVAGFVDQIDATGRIHSIFHQTITQTGRISSSEPNLQNIPVRQPLGRQLRKLFTAAPGCVLIDADYSQIELRVLAFLSQDEKMLSGFLSGVDVHTKTASEVFGVPIDLVTPEMRSQAKAVNFGIVYGISDFSLAADIHVSRKEAKQYIENYFATYHGIKEYLDETVLKARANGYVTTLFGRRRYIPELAVQNHNVRAFGERVARNTPIQGTAADLLKIAMVRVAQRLREEGCRARIILQVHDELILECPKDEVDAASRILQEEMEQAGGKGIPLKVDIGVGEDWYSAKG